MNSVNQLIEQRLAQRQDIAELETKVGEVEASRDTFTAVIGYIEDNHYQVNGSLEVTISALPQTIDLGNVSHASGGLIISGMAPSEIEVLVYAKKLRDSGRFSEVIISAMEDT